MTDNNPILVTGATGQQGGAVARELLRRGRAVRALVRDADKPAARELEAAGAVLVVGDLDDSASLKEALNGVHGVFSVQTFLGEGGVVAEERQGRALADAAQAAGVEHFVYSSVSAADSAGSVPHFASKARVEAHLKELGLPLTVLRPAFFIDNYAFFGPSADDQGELVLAQALLPETRLQMIATRDIGVFAANAFDQPEAYLGRTVEIAGDELTGDQIAAAFAQGTGRPVRFQPVPVEQLASFNKELGAMFEFFNVHTFTADLDALRTEHPGLTSLADWIRATNWQPAPSAH